MVVGTAWSLQLGFRVEYTGSRVFGCMPAGFLGCVLSVFYQKVEATRIPYPSLNRLTFNQPGKVPMKTTLHPYPLDARTL